MQKLHCQEGNVAVGADLVNRDDVVVLDGGGGLGLAQEAGSSGRVGGDRRPHHLERHPAPKLHVLRFQHHPHPSRARAFARHGSRRAVPARRPTAAAPESPVHRPQSPVLRPASGCRPRVPRRSRPRFRGRASPPAEACRTASRSGRGPRVHLGRRSSHGMGQEVLRLHRLHGSQTRRATRQVLLDPRRFRLAALAEQEGLEFLRTGTRCASGHELPPARRGKGGSSLPVHGWSECLTGRAPRRATRAALPVLSAIGAGPAT